VRIDSDIVAVRDAPAFPFPLFVFSIITLPQLLRRFLVPVVFFLHDFWSRALVSYSFLPLPPCRAPETIK